MKTLTLKIDKCGQCPYFKSEGNYGVSSGVFCFHENRNEPFKIEDHRHKRYFLLNDCPLLELEE